MKDNIISHELECILSKIHRWIIWGCFCVIVFFGFVLYAFFVFFDKPEVHEIPMKVESVEVVGDKKIELAGVIRNKNDITFLQDESKKVQLKIKDKTLDFVFFEVKGNGCVSIVMEKQSLYRGDTICILFEKDVNLFGNYFKSIIFI